MAAAYQPLTDRGFRWFAESTPVPPAVVGAIVALALGGIALWFTWVIGSVDDVAAGRAPSIVVRAVVTLFMMVGYLPMAVYYLDRWTDEHLQAIAERFDLEPGAARFPRAATNLAGSAGVVGMYCAFLLEPSDPLLLFQPGRWSAGFVVPLIGIVFMGWYYLRFTFLLAWSAIVVSRTAPHIRRVDLLDGSAVKPYAQQGVRSSLLAVVSLSVSANLWLDPNSPTIGTAVTVVVSVLATGLALIIPTWGIHERLKVLKRSELASVRSAIAAASDPSTRSVEDAHQLRANLALERRLMEVSEWPFDAGSYGRVTLYVLLGLGSWVGAALVERGLESLGA